MQGSILIYGGNKTARDNEVLKILNTESFEALKNNPDTYIIKPLEGKKSISIKQAREGMQFLQTKPFSSDTKYLVVLEAEKLTLPAQNSLLKTLEEPPSYAVIVLEAKTENSLVETIISRCRRQMIQMTEGIQTKLETSVKDILNMTVGERLSWVEKSAKEDRGDIAELLEGWVSELRLELDTNAARNIELVIRLSEDLQDTNVNMRLGLENLVVHLISS
jgi:hypothetical protein